MKFATYNELQTRLMELFRKNEYEEALEIATLHAEEFPEYFHLVNYWRSVLAARLGNQKLAVELLREVIETGFWYGENILRRSPSYQELQGMPEFENLAAINRRLREADPEQRYPLLTLRPQGRCANGAERCPMFLGLHSNGATAQDSIGFWQPAAAAGWLVGAPQSSQSIWKGAYGWDDRETARADTIKAYQSLVEQYAVDPGRLILAGHSLGGDTAIWLALTGALPSLGFIAAGPAGPLINNPDEHADIILTAQERGLRGYIVAGAEDDSIPHDELEIFVDMLNEANIPCELEIMPHAGHDYSPEFNDALIRALSYISQV